MATNIREECPNCDDSQLDIQVLDEQRVEHLALCTKRCRWVCLNCGWTSEQWSVTN